MRQSSGSRQVVVRQSSGSLQEVVRQLSGSFHSVADSPGSHQVFIRRSSKKNTTFPSFFYFSFIPKILRYDLMFADWSTYLVDRKFKMMTNFTFATKTNPPLIEGTVYIRTVSS